MPNVCFAFHNLSITTTPASENASFPLEIRLLGGFDVRVNGTSLTELRQWEQSLLARIVLLHGREISRNWLARSVWPDREEEQAIFYLRKAITTLREALGSEGKRLQSTGSRTLKLDLTGSFVDVLSFDQACRSSDRGELQAAANLYQGPFLPDCPDQWATLERENRERAYQAVRERLGS